MTPGPLLLNYQPVEIMVLASKTTELESMASSGKVAPVIQGGMLASLSEISLRESLDATLDIVLSFQNRFSLFSP